MLPRGEVFERKPRSIARDRRHAHTVDYHMHTMALRRRAACRTCLGHVMGVSWTWQQPHSRTAVLRVGEQNQSIHSREV